MNNFLKKVLNINLPTTDEVVQQAKAHEAAVYAQQRAAQQEEMVPPLGTIQFTLLADGTMNLRMQWTDESKNAGTVFGEFIHRIHTGNFKGSCLELLLSMQKRNIKNKIFVEAACEKWRELMQKQDNQPVVSPLSVFGVTRIGDGDDD